jgi:arginine decarboxylase
MENSMTDSLVKKEQAPLFDAMIAHNRNNPVSLHVPGHKSGQASDPAAAPFYKGILSIDYTEIPGLDDLHQAEGVIQQAQQLAAECFGAEESFFLVGGSTVGNLAMITTVCEPGDILLVQRNVHKSVIHGLMLARAKAVFLTPQWEPDSGMATGVTVQEVEEALRTYPEAKGLLITNPNYYGMGIDIRPLAQLLHQWDKPLLVDEAHGAHFGFHPALPQSALTCGADIVVQSTHKMLSAMTMGAMLHIQGNRINRTIIRRRLSLLQSSSPSYPILASLDLARRQMHIHGEALIQQALEVVMGFIRELAKLPCYGVSSSSSSDIYQDPFKVSIHDVTGTLLGPELRELLEDHGCYPEMADEKRVLLVFTLGSTEEDVSKILRALSNICLKRKLEKKELAGRIANIMKVSPFTRISEPVAFSLDYAGGSREFGVNGTVWISLKEAAGKRSAGMVVPYPPGIPLLYPGEWITAQTAQYIQELAGLGIRFQGTLDGSLQTIEVFT